MKWMRLPTVATLALGAALATAEPSYDAPPMRSAPHPGLAMRAYKANRVMRRMRDPLPGVMPDRVVVARSLELSEADDFAGFDDMFYVMMDGTVTVERPGEYAFSIDADDGADVAIDGVVIATDFWKPGTAEVGTGTVTLAAGPHAIRVRMFEGDGGQGVAVKWRVPGSGEFVSIPLAALSHEPGAIVAATQPTTVPAEMAKHRFIYQTRGFAGLKDDQAELLVNLLEGSTTISEQAREDLGNYVEATHFRELPYWHQTKTLTGFVGGWYSGSTRRRAVRTRAAFTISDAKPNTYDYWRGQTQDGFEQFVTVGNHRVKVLTPSADAIERSSAAEAIAGLPERYRRLIREVRVAPYGSASEFNGGGSTIYVRLRKAAGTDTLDAAFAHETGHLFQHQVGLYDEWVEATERDALSVSEYGRRNPSEDFAEFNRLYISTDESPEQLASLERLFPHRMGVYRQMLQRLDAKRDDADQRPRE